MLSWCFFLSNVLCSFLSCGMAPALYLEGITVRGPSSFLPYFLIIFIINILIFVICCLACPSLIVAQPGG